MPRNLSIGKRRTCAWQSLELARQVDVPARSAVRQPALGAQRGLRTHVAVGTPLARAVVRGDLRQPRRLARIELAPLARDLLERRFGCSLGRLRHGEHTFDSNQKLTRNKAQFLPTVIDKMISGRSLRTFRKTMRALGKVR